ncbi:hypothetical protein WR25_14446 [Diploscapter pachys]|uniref:Uncharacterized protein n=1 Tax=Diploscapter pachys TaxID=2018661 RepID=A0A2A2JG57_9BILA|nr:hypothetical protein WR25_14446 [Diploscapter pachys]
MRNVIHKTSGILATANINNTFDEGTASRWTVNRWFYRFAAGDTSLQENERSERSSSVDNNELQSAIKANPEATTRTVTATVYVDQLQKLIDTIQEKRPRRSIVHLLHDNAQLHVASGTHQKTTKLGWHLIIYPSYSPGLAPPDYHLFRPLKLHLREKKIDKYDDLKTAVNDFFASQSPEFWAQGINDLPNKWAKVTDLNGQYILDSWWF